MNIQKPINKVLKFPKLHPSPDEMPTTHEEAVNALVDVKKFYIQESSEMVLESMYAMLEDFGYNINNPKMHSNDVELLEDALISLMSRFQKLWHPLHDLVDDLYPDEENIEEEELSSEDDSNT